MFGCLCCGTGILFGASSTLDDVSLHKELSEKEQVTSVQKETSIGVFFLNMAGRVSFEVVITGNGHGNTDHHLHDLQGSNGHRVEPLGLHFHGHQKVVTVHESMDSKVHGNKDESDTRRRGKAMPAVKKDGDMMVPVQEHEFFLVNDNEESVQQFRELADAKQENPETGRTTASSFTSGSTEVVA